ncbi:MAG TPA: MotA/TolQ/ExbB proton channel family protein [Burkholderiaceae bacterium]|nr:MotA/TolQ/ExbB proton channel family protein [Burkholderiaceae bacterium]
MALIVWKAIELYLPALQRRTSLERTVTSDIELDEGLERLERGMSLLATIAATAPFIGLGATVLHIMQALNSLAGSNAEAGVIAVPIASALYSTLLGLTSAVPAAIAYNLMQRRLQVIENRARRNLQAAAAPSTSAGHPGGGARPPTSVRTPRANSRPVLATAPTPSMGRPDVAEHAALDPAKPDSRDTSAQTKLPDPEIWVGPDPAAPTDSRGNHRRNSLGRLVRPVQE